MVHIVTKNCASQMVKSEIKTFCDIAYNYSSELLLRKLYDAISCTLYEVKYVKVLCKKELHRQQITFFYGIDIFTFIIQLRPPEKYGLNVRLLTTFLSSQVSIASKSIMAEKYINMHKAKMLHTCVQTKHYVYECMSLFPFQGSLISKYCFCTLLLHVY